MQVFFFSFKPFDRRMRSLHDEKLRRVALRGIKSIARARLPRTPQRKMPPSDESRLLRPRFFHFRKARPHDALVCLDARLIERIYVGKFALIGD